MKHIDQFTPVLSPELLMKHNFFELYPVDGGGTFIQREILGSVDDAAITEAVLNGALADFGPLEAIDFLKYERWSTIEKSCWINRMYFIVPIAHQYALHGDEKLAQLLRQILLRFKRTYLPPSTCEAACELQRDVLYKRDHDYNAKGSSYDADIPYQWFDFQPASRIIHTLHALWFMRNSPSFSPQDWEELDEMLFQHGQQIYWVEKYGSTPARGNHQALRAVALLYAADYFKDAPEAAEWRETALSLCEYHILNDFLPDGMLIDLSPSYHFFECWIARDMKALSERAHSKGVRPQDGVGTPVGGHDGELGATLKARPQDGVGTRTCPVPQACGKSGLSPEAIQRVQKAFDVCGYLCQPDGLSPVISDGYPLDMEIFLSTIQNGERRRNYAVSLDASQIAVKRDGGQYFLLDASPLLDALSHYHAGKLAVTYFHGGRPFLVDSGCCSYDDDAFAEWFKQPQAHSTLLIDGQGDSILEGRYHWLVAPTNELSPWNGNVLTAVMHSKVLAWKGVTWRRTATVEIAGLTLFDTVECDHEVTMEFIFNLHPDVKAEILPGNKVLLTNGSTALHAEFSAPVELLDGTGYLNYQKVPCKRLCVRITGKGGQLQLIIRN